MSQSLLIELGSEELPPTALAALSSAFTESFKKSFQEANVPFSKIESFSTPRRLAVRLTEVAEKQPDQAIEKLGPFVKAAYDKDGNPTKAALGFAKSNGVELNQLTTQDTDKGERLVFKSTQEGQATISLLEGFLQDALKALPIPKRMKWGASKTEFSRPVHWLTCLYGEQSIAIKALGLTASNISYGHRIHAPEAFVVEVDDYCSQLKKHFVLANSKTRKETIRNQLAQIAKDANATLPMDEDLLDEVNALVEWPVALKGSFDKAFLEVPKEALISSMKSHQKYFHLLDESGDLLPQFITVANLDSSNPATIVDGNERVVRPRLADAAFFYESDKKLALDTLIEQLKAVTFQEKLGSLYDKAVRIEKLASFIAEALNVDISKAKRAAMLAKTDLLTDMVGEFPDLQGTMGHYYALQSGEAASIALAIEEQYLPKHAEDEVPSSPLGQVLALADRIDTIVGIFGIGLEPTGNKDPFALRRASLAVINIIKQKQLPLDLQNLFNQAAAGYQDILPNLTIDKALSYTLDRLRGLYAADAIRTEVFLAVHDLGLSDLVDIDKRVQALAAFDTTDAALSLSSANKRVNNLLAKSNFSVDNSVTINQSLLQESAESALAEQLNSLTEPLQALTLDKNYQEALSKLSTLKVPVDNFFNDVMIMVDDEALKQNRLCLLAQLKRLFDSIANISLLAKS